MVSPVGGNKWLLKFVFIESSIQKIWYKDIDSYSTETNYASFVYYSLN